MKRWQLQGKELGAHDWWEGKLVLIPAQGIATPLTENKPNEIYVIHNSQTEGNELVTPDSHPELFTD